MYLITTPSPLRGYSFTRGEFNTFPATHPPQEENLLTTLGQIVIQNAISLK